MDVESFTSWWEKWGQDKETWQGSSWFIYPCLFPFCGRKSQTQRSKRTLIGVAKKMILVTVWHAPTTKIHYVPLQVLWLLSYCFILYQKHASVWKLHFRNPQNCEKMKNLFLKHIYKCVHLEKVMCSLTSWWCTKPWILVLISARCSVNISVVLDTLNYIRLCDEMSCRGEQLSPSLRGFSKGDTLCRLNWQKCVWVFGFAFLTPLSQSPPRPPLQEEILGLLLYTE